MVDLNVLTQAMSDLDEDVLKKAIDEVLSKDDNAAEAQEVVKACQQGMTLVGERYDSGEYFIGDLVFAGEVLQSVMDKLKPALSAGSSAKGGKMSWPQFLEIFMISAKIFLGPWLKPQVSR